MAYLQTDIIGMFIVCCKIDNEKGNWYRFSKPENVKKILESGAIPDAAVIHAARKRRQRARELGGDFVPIEEEETEDTGGRLRREEDQDEGSDEERIDMDANPAIRDHVRLYPFGYCLI